MFLIPLTQRLQLLSQVSKLIPNVIDQEVSTIRSQLGVRQLIHRCVLHLLTQLNGMKLFRKLVQRGLLGVLCGGDQEAQLLYLCAQVIQTLGMRLGFRLRAQGADEVGTTRARLCMGSLGEGSCCCACRCRLWLGQWSLPKQPWRRANSVLWARHDFPYVQSEPQERWKSLLGVLWLLLSHILTAMLDHGGHRSRLGIFSGLGWVEQDNQKSGVLKV